MRALIEVLYKIAQKTGKSQYKEIANAQARFMSNFANEMDPTWLWGTVLECIGFYHEHNTLSQEMAQKALLILNWARKRKLTIDIKGLTYGHF